MATDADKRLERRVTAAAEEALAARGFVTAIDVLTGLGWLAPSSERAWRQGRIPYLEDAVTANQGQDLAGDALVRSWAQVHALKSSETAYVAAPATGALRFRACVGSMHIRCVTPNLVLFVA